MLRIDLAKVLAWSGFVLSLIFLLGVTLRPS
jgi:hypothetical protein